MKILFTGSSGFVGQRVMRELAGSTYEVHTISRRAPVKGEQHHHHLDIMDQKSTSKLVSSIAPDILIHLAWDVTHGEFWHAKVNQSYATASINLFNAFADNGGRKIIATGTCAEYPTSSHPVFEGAEITGDLTPYGIAKRATWNHLNTLSNTHGIDVCWLRIFGIFGPREPEMRFIPSAIKAIKEGKEFSVNNRSSFFDYVNVSDVASLIHRSISAKGFGAINVGSGYHISLYELYKVIESYMKTGVFKEIEAKEVPDENSRIPDISKLNDLGFSFRNSLKEGLSRYIKEQDHVK